MSDVFLLRKNQQAWQMILCFSPFLSLRIFVVFFLAIGGGSSRADFFQVSGHEGGSVQVWNFLEAVGTGKWSISSLLHGVISTFPVVYNFQDYGGPKNHSLRCN